MAEDTDNSGKIRSLDDECGALFICEESKDGCPDDINNCPYFSKYAPIVAIADSMDSWSGGFF